MAARTTVPALTDNQVRHLLAVISHADELLASAGRALDESRSPFPRLKLDTGPEERAWLTSFVAAARECMAATCDRLGVFRPEPTISARWAAETALDFACNAFADLEPGTMRGYGPVPNELARELVASAGVLQELMQRGVAFLRDPHRSTSTHSGPRGPSTDENPTRAPEESLATGEGA